MLNYLKKRTNLKYGVFFIFFTLLILFIIAKNTMMLSFSEIFNPKLSKIEGKVNKFIDKGYKISITYLYFKGGRKDIEKNIEVFKEIVDYLDEKYEGINDIFQRGKVSLKIIQFGMTPKEKLENLAKFVNYAKSKNIFVWISAFHYKNVHEECSYYLYLRDRGYTNLGITIACYHTTASAYVDLILQKGGHIRLVKGYYNDGQIRDWTKVTQNYLHNSKKIIKSVNYHQLATHDFKNILDPLNKIKRLDTLYNIEFGFFVNADKHVERESKKYGINLSHKCIFITFGRKFRYIRSNFLHISYPRLIRAKNII